MGRLLAAQHPDLAGLPRRVASRGWDNVMVRIGTVLAARLPARAQAVPLARNEHRWLPGLAALLPVPVPVPVRTGAPGEGYDWPWSVVPWFEGTPADAVPAGDRDLWAADLAEVLAALHVPAPREAPANAFRGVPMTMRDEDVRARLGVDGPGGLVLRRAWAAGVDAPAWAGPPLWLHGDPHPANLLTSQGRLTAVLDFGDLTAGDPASDLATAWLCFGAEARALFFETYAARTGLGARTLEALRRRARGWAAALVPPLSAHPGEHPGLAAVAAHAEEQLVAELGPATS